MTKKSKAKHLYKRYYISNILPKTEALLDAMEKFMQKYNLPKIEVKLECKRKYA